MREGFEARQTENLHTRFVRECGDTEVLCMLVDRAGLALCGEELVEV